MTEEKLGEAGHDDLLRNGVQYRGLVLINAGRSFPERLDAEYLWKEGARRFPNATNIVMRFEDDQRVLVVGLKVITFTTFFETFDDAVDKLKEPSKKRKK